LDLQDGKSSAEHGAHDAMSFLFGRSKQKLAQDMIKSIKDLLGKLAAQDGQVAKVRTHQYHHLSVDVLLAGKIHGTAR